MPGARPDPAGLQHRIHRMIGAGENGFDGAVAPVPHPAFEATEFRLVLRPGAKPHALDLSSDDDVNDAWRRHEYP